MKLIVERAALLKALGHVQSVVERRNTIPILSNVLLRADAAGGPAGDPAGAAALSLSATDMDLEIVERVPAQIQRDGRITAPAHTLYDIVRKLREGAQIEIEVGGERNAMVLRSGRSTFTLACLPPEDYPVMASGELPHNFAFAAAETKALIDRTRFAISTEETRYYLNGIYLHATKNDEVPVIRAVATDGHRLARVEMVLPEGAAGMPGIIVPRKTVLELRKLVDESEDEVQVALSETKIRFAVGEAALTSKLIDGTFPDYDRVIPSDNDKVLEVNCKEFAEAVDRVSTISTEKQPRGQARHRARRQRGQPRGVGDQPRKRHRHRGNRGALPRRPARDRLQFTLPAGHHGTDRRRRRPIRDVRLGLADDRARQRRHQRALRADADAGVTKADPPGGRRRLGMLAESRSDPHIIDDVDRGTGSPRQRRCRGPAGLGRACRA